MKVGMEEGHGYLALVCLECDEALWVFQDRDSSLNKPEAGMIELAQVLMAHGYGCRKSIEFDKGIRCQVCGGELYHFRGAPQAKRCGTCNRTISPAEQRAE